jgi:hypothetical protein
MPILDWLQTTHGTSHTDQSTSVTHLEMPYTCRIESRLSDRKQLPLHARWHEKLQKQNILVSQSGNLSDIGFLSGRIQEVGFSYAGLAS